MAVRLYQYCNRGAPAPSLSVLVLVVLTNVAVVTTHLELFPEFLPFAALGVSPGSRARLARCVTTAWAVAATESLRARAADHGSVAGACNAKQIVGDVTLDVGA